MQAEIIQKIHKGLCKKSDCHCFSRSFASERFAVLWSPKNGKKIPRNVSKNSRKQFVFYCPDCNHEFLSTPKRMILGCEICRGTKVCDGPNCSLCFSNSLEAQDFIADLVTIRMDLRSIPIATTEKMHFKCSECNHDEELTPIQKRDGNCSFCKKKNGCFPAKCDVCKPNSATDHKFSEFWSERNELEACQVRKTSSKAYWYKCGYCKNEFLHSPKSLNNKMWICGICRE